MQIVRGKGQLEQPVCWPLGVWPSDAVQDQPQVIDELAPKAIGGAVVRHLDCKPDISDAAEVRQGLLIERNTLLAGNRDGHEMPPLSVRAPRSQGCRPERDFGE